VSLVAATVVTLVAIPEKERIMVSAVIYPEQMSQSSDEYAFGVSFIATHDLDDVEVRARTLPSFTGESLGLEPLGQEDLELQPPLILLRRASSRCGIEVEARRFDLTGKTSVQELVYYDFLPVLERLSPNLSDSALREITASYGFLWEGGELEACFRGGAAIFPAETVSLSKIVVEVDAGLAYSWERETSPKREMGGIRIDAIAKGSRVDLLYYIDGRWAGGGSLLWKLDVVAEGEILHSSVRLINFAGTS